MLQTYLESDAISVDIDSTTLRSVRFLHSADDSQLQILIDRGVLSQSENSIWAMIEILFERSTFISAGTFLRLIGLESTSPQLATITTKTERISTLHFVAKMLARGLRVWNPTDSTITDWLAIAYTVLQHGFQPSTLAPLNYTERTALWCLVNECFWDPSGDEWALNAVRAWARTVQEAGLDLLEYGRHESEIWRSGGPDRRSSDEEVTFYLNYSHDPDEWSIIRSCLTTERVPLYQATRMPGSFDLTSDMPEYICWHPGYRDEGQCSWQYITDAKIWARDRYGFETEDSSVDIWSQITTKAHPSADDTSLTSLLVSRSRRWTITPRRSASLPPTRKGHRDKKQDPIWSDSYRLHYCTATFSYAHGYPQVRGCANGACDPDISADLVHSSFDWKSLSFLADIRDCQDKFLSRDGVFYSPRPSLSVHTGTKECPLGCRKVHLDKLHVPEACRNFHPRRYTSDRWNDP